MKDPLYADDATENVGLLLRLRLPWLIAGLLIGCLITILVSRFERLLEANVSLAFFIPIIVYMSDAVGTQAQTIYVRNMSKHQARFSVYLIKEFFLGLILGAIFGLTIGGVAWFWLNSSDVAFSVGLAMFASISASTILGIAIPAILKTEHNDPAIGSGPFTTVIQDMISLLIYFGIASLIVLG